MRGSDLVLAISVFLASTVEMVEALTIVVAVGVTRGWRQALVGAGIAVGVLGLLVGAFGPALVRVPLDALRIIVGGLLLILGLQWYRKAALRAAGLKAKHDEDAIFAAQVAELTLASSPHAASTIADAPGPAAGGVGEDATGPPPQRHDVAGMTVAFKGVFLEGLEVVVIVLTLGAASHRIGLAAAAAGAAVVLVAGVGIVMARQLAGVPENAMKFLVGIMLVSFGTFWSGEGVGLHWPGSDLALLVLIVVYAAFARLLVLWLRRGAPPATTSPLESAIASAPPAAAAASPGPVPRRRAVRWAVTGLGRYLWDFVVGDTPELAAAAVVVVAIAALLVHIGTPAGLAGAVLVVLLASALGLSAGRARRAYLAAAA